MPSMSFDQRINAIKNWMKEEILPRFNPPSNLNPTLILSDIANGLNAHLPAKIEPDQMPSILRHVQDNLIRNAMSRTLPAVRYFIEASKNIPRSDGESRQIGQTHSDMSTYLRLAIDRVRGGKPVSDFYIEGKGRRQLLQHGITEDELAPYDEYIQRIRRDVYHDDPMPTEEPSQHEQVLSGSINRMN